MAHEIFHDLWEIEYVVSAFLWKMEFSSALNGLEFHNPSNQRSLPISLMVFAFDHLDRSIMHRDDSDNRYNGF